MCYCGLYTSSNQWRRYVLLLSLFPLWRLTERWAGCFLVAFLVATNSLDESSKYNQIHYEAIFTLCAAITQGFALVGLVVLRVIIIRRTKSRFLFAPFCDRDGGYKGEQDRDYLDSSKLSKSLTFGRGLHGLTYVFHPFNRGMSVSHLLSSIYDLVANIQFLYVSGLSRLWPSFTPWSGSPYTL